MNEYMIIIKENVGQQKKTHIATSTYTEALRETYQIYMEFIH